MSLNQENVTERSLGYPKSKTKSKFDDPKLDLSWLYSTLQKEINHEASYNLENDAKIRAVTQGTANYEQFRQMVLGAHIRPLERKDKIEGCQNGKRPHVVWNTVARDDKDCEQKGALSNAARSRISLAKGSQIIAGRFDHIQMSIEDGKGSHESVEGNESPGQDLDPRLVSEEADCNKEEDDPEEREGA